ncbi:MAG: S8 family serine peptidase [Anaerolineales bacterium]
MPTRKPISVLLVLCLLLSTLSVRVSTAQAQAGGDSAPRTTAEDPAVSAAAESALPNVPTDQIIVRYKDSARVTEAQAASTDRLAALSAAAGVTLAYFRPMSGEAHVLKLPQALPEAEVAAIAARLAASPEVEYAEPDSRMFPMATPNDPQYGSQWHYSAPVAGSYGANLPAAWDVITGSASIVVAVLDTGILFDHPDLIGRTIGGYDMIADVPTANDGDGRDANAADPGDWVVVNECGAGSQPDDSSWHGTHVAGTIGASTNNSVGVSGINWNSLILPVRVLGKCGGFTSDIADGIRWAAGLPVSLVPNNPNPARVINMSLGGGGACGSSYQNAINAATTAGTLVIVAAGNSNLNASGFTPANCNNVVTVASNDRNGNKADYSNFGATVEITAPGGDTSPTATNGVLSTLNAGTTSPAAHNYVFYQGTSMATPHVAGVASLVFSVNPALTPAQVTYHLTSTVTAFPGGSTCNTSICGTGILNAFGAVVAAGPPLNNKVYLPVVLKDNTSGGGGGGLVPNGGFESGATVWTTFSNNGRTLIRTSFAPNTLTPYSGSWGVWLGGALNESDYIQQSVTVPAGAPYLYFWHYIGSADFPSLFDFGYVSVNGTTVTQLSLDTSTNSTAWAKQVVNLSAYAGQTVTLRIGAECDFSDNSNWFIDEVGFQSTP